MSWTVWILASACFLACYDLAKKASVRDNAVLPVLLIATAFGCAAFVGSLAATGNLTKAVGHIGGSTLLLATIKSIIVSSSWIFTYYALRTLPITIATPIRASAPALVFLIAMFLYGEIPSILQFIGIVSALSGYWAFSWAGRHEGIDFLRNRAIWCALVGALLSAISALWDKYVFQVRAESVEGVQLVFQAELVMIYGIILVVQRLFGRNERFVWRNSIPFVGILLAAADWLYFNGLAVPEVPISVASLMRRFSVVITFVIGARFFHETNLQRKAIALGLILAGVTLLCL